MNTQIEIKRKKITKNDLPFVLKELSTNINKIKLTEENRISLLKSIIEYNNTNEIGDSKMFYDYFYAYNRHIEKAEKRFKKILLSSSKFKIVHGYSRSGKTTFLKKVAYDLKGDSVGNAIYINFDFEKGFSIDSYKSKVKHFVEIEFKPIKREKRIHKIISIKEFILFINRFFENLDSNKKHDTLSIVKDTFTSINNNFKLYFDESNDGDLPLENDIDDSFKKHLLDNITDHNVHNYIIYLTFYRIFKCGLSLFKDDNVKIIIVFDNLDENMADNDVSFINQPQIRFSDFLYSVFEKDKTINGIFTDTLSVFFENQNQNSLINFYEQVKVVYLFRTANFLVFANLLHNNLRTPKPLEKRLVKSLYRRKEIFHYQSISNTSNILNIRLEIFNDILTLIYGKEKVKYIPKGFYLLKKLSENLENINDIDESINNKYENLDKAIKHLFNLWNGDNTELFSAISHNYDEIHNLYAKNEKVITVIEKKCFDGKYTLLRGIFLHFFLFLYRANISEENSKIFDYSVKSFMDKDEGKVKNINRMILNLIINETIKNGNTESIVDITNKGIGFYYLLNKIEHFIANINIINEQAYSFEDVKLFFKDLSSVSISSYNNLFSIFKNQTFRNAKNELVSSNLYDLLDDIALYEKNKSIKIEKIVKSNIDKLNSIRIFTNHNAMFISSELLTEFELYSFLKGNDLPLLMLFNNEKSIDDNINNFVSIVDGIYDDTEIIMNNMVNFYIKNLIFSYDPNSFIKDSLFSLRLPITNEQNKVIDYIGKFQFRQTISRHISYLNYVRFFLLNHCDKTHLFTQTNKENINNKLKAIISNYCVLYIENYNKIDRVKEIRIEKDHPLIRAYNAFNNMKKRIDLMGKNNFSMIK